MFPFCSVLALTVALAASGPLNVAHAKIAVQPETSSPRGVFSRFGKQKQVIDQPQSIEDIITTPLGKVAEAFENGVLEQETPVGGMSTSREINMPNLLKACHSFETDLRRVGQYPTAKDLLNNIHKVEALYNSAPADQRRTMSSLLKFEKDLGIHPDQDDDDHNRRLKDPSGAMGLLWIHRSLSFNHRMYSNLVANPRGNTKEAALEAYHSVLEPFHGWALRRLYTLTFSSSTPPWTEFLCRLGGFDKDKDDGKVRKHYELTPKQEDATLRDIRRLLSAWQPLIVQWRQTFRELGLDDKRRV